jgi:hypothetical protein
MIAGLVMRTALKQLLLGNTLAEGRVFDSAIAPVDQIAESLPFVAVSTEDAEYTDIGAFDLMSGNREVHLVIEIACATTTPVTIDGNSATTISIPETDAALEATIDFLSRQIFRLMTAGSGTWFDIFRSVCLTVDQVSVKRGVSDKNGSRFAARQFVLQAQVISEPEVGADPSGVWARAVEAMAQEPELANLAQIMEQLIKGEEIPEWPQFAAAVGLLPEAASMINLGPIDPDLGGADTSDDPALVTELGVDPDGNWIVDGQEVTGDPNLEPPTVEGDTVT